jgi:D-alanyl-D-alanine carboxypeptidase
MIRNAHLLVHSEAIKLHLNLAGGNAQTGLDQEVQAGQPVFMASAGKLFTAALVALLFEQGKLSFEDHLVDFLDSGLLNGLHVFQGNEYTAQIKLKHLLNHTSGLHDYFEDKPKEGPGMIDRIINEPDRVYRPEEVVKWSKENMKSHFPPGKGFHYSDTGYHLLGLVIEAITSMPFHAALTRFVFEPLGMRQAFLLGHSGPLEENPMSIAGVFFGDINVVGYRSLSVDYAGGGVTAPLEDFLKFMRALAQGQLLRAETLQRMNDCGKFTIGIDYGYGMMMIRTVPVLMPARYNCWGNAGSTGAFMFYHPRLDAFLIGSLNQFRYHRKGIQLMLRIIDILDNELRKRRGT